jgi:hypothetical protein
LKSYGEAARKADRRLPPDQDGDELEPDGDDDDDDDEENGGVEQSDGEAESERLVNTLSTRDFVAFVVERAMRNRTDEDISADIVNPNREVPGSNPNQRASGRTAHRDEPGRNSNRDGLRLDRTDVDADADANGRGDAEYEHVGMCPDCPYENIKGDVNNGSRAVRVFGQDFALEVAIVSHACSLECSLEANMRATNGIPLGSRVSTALTVVIIHHVETLKVRLAHSAPSAGRKEDGQWVRLVSLLPPLPLLLLSITLSLLMMASMSMLRTM